MKGLVASNAHVQYQSSISSALKVMANVKVFQKKVKVPRSTRLSVQTGSSTGLFLFIHLPTILVTEGYQLTRRSGMDRNCTCTTRPWGQQQVSAVFSYGGDRGTRYCLRTDGWKTDERISHKLDWSSTGRANKRPKGPHIVHLSTMCHHFEETARVANFYLLIGPKKFKLGRGRWGLASCQVSLNSVKQFRGEVENFSTNRRQGQPSCFSNQPQKQKLGRGRKDLASCQVSLNSVQWFQRRSRKCFSQSEARGGHLVFPISPKNINLVEDVEILLPIKFVEFRSVVSEEKSMSQPIRGKGSQFVCFFFRCARKTKTW